MTSSSHSSSYILYLFFTIATLLSKNMSPGRLLYTDISLSFFPPVWVLASAAVSFSSLHPSIHSTGNLFGSCSWLSPLGCNLHSFPKRICPATVLGCICDLSMSFMKFKMGCMHKTGEIDNYLLMWMCPYLRSHRARWFWSLHISRQSCRTLKGPERSTCPPTWDIVISCPIIWNLFFFQMWRVSPSCSPSSYISLLHNAISACLVPSPSLW